MIELAINICGGNIVVCKPIKPGSKLEWPLTLMISDENIKGDLTFRLGYDACICKEPLRSNVTCNKRSTKWSEPVTIHIQ